MSDLKPFFAPGIEALFEPEMALRAGRRVPIARPGAQAAVQTGLSFLIEKSKSLPEYVNMLAIV